MDTLPGVIHLLVQLEGELVINLCLFPLTLTISLIYDVIVVFVVEV